MNKNQAFPWDHPRFRSWIGVARACQLMQQAMTRAIADLDIKTPHLDILINLYRFDGISQQELARKLLVGRSNMSMLLPQLEKRGLVEAGDDPLVLVEDADLRARLEDMTRRLLPELWPFDYGRFEFRYDPATNDLLFMEVNLSCNLWSKKTISRSAASIGVDHAALVETIVGHSLARQGLLSQAPIRVAA